MHPALTPLYIFWKAIVEPCLFIGLLIGVLYLGHIIAEIFVHLAR